MPPDDGRGLLALQCVAVNSTMVKAGMHKSITSNADMQSSADARALLCLSSMLKEGGGEGGDVRLWYLRAHLVKALANAN